jgi:hypothetical protein
MAAFITFNSRAVRRAAPKEAVVDAFARPLDGRMSTPTPLGGREPYSADGGRP